MKKLLLVGIGGFIGAILRYLIGGYVQQMSKSIGFPYGTFAVNIIGCFVIGLLSYLAETHGAFTAETRTIVFIGLLGSFTTFSTFGNETMNLLRDGENLYAFANIIAHVVLGLSAVWLGRSCAYLIWK